MRPFTGEWSNDQGLHLQKTVSPPASSNELAPIPIPTGIWSDLGLYRSYAQCPNHCEFICALPLLCPEDAVLLVMICLWLLQLLPLIPSSTMIPEPGEDTVQYLWSIEA